MQDDLYARFTCVDCKVNTFEIDEYYMVHDEIWLSAGMRLNGGMLCIGCLEERLGRQLVAADFTSYPINTGFWQARSRRLRSRLTCREAKAA